MSKIKVNTKINFIVHKINVYVNIIRCKWPFRKRLTYMKKTCLLWLRACIHKRKHCSFAIFVINTVIITVNDKNKYKKLYKYNKQCRSKDKKVSWVKELCIENNNFYLILCGCGEKKKKIETTVTNMLA